jgi:hypothetical protein
MVADTVRGQDLHQVLIPAEVGRSSVFEVGRPPSGGVLAGQQYGQRLLRRRLGRSMEPRCHASGSESLVTPRIVNLSA